MKLVINSVQNFTTQNSYDKRVISLAPSLISLTRSLTAFPLLESISSLTRFSSSAALTNLSSDSSSGKATLISSTKNILFILCSAYSGHAIIGTPAHTASKVEFHPQWVTNPPTESWFSTASCGAHDFTTRPLFLVLSKKPLGNNVSKFGSGSAEGCLA
ncbi:hypothetical protein RJ640_023130 [Escallonia rubra]|uniref:Uncharacterized protein n=1 Tax=Escallonia rubra TaxID=112253 RepID=A0AA88UIQ8_9ASTE|nr:hypothetical protein RJ640_023130 [Escallonia rubra]